MKWQSVLKNKNRNFEEKKNPIQTHSEPVASRNFGEKKNPIKKHSKPVASGMSNLFKSFSVNEISMFLHVYGCSSMAFKC